MRISLVSPTLFVKSYFLIQTAYSLPTLSKAYFTSFLYVFSDNRLTKVDLSSLSQVSYVLKEDVTSV